MRCLECVVLLSLYIYKLVANWLLGELRSAALGSVRGKPFARCERFDLTLQLMRRVLDEAALV